MNEADLCGKQLFRLGKKANRAAAAELMFSKQLLSAKSENEFSRERNLSEDSSRLTGNRCGGVSSSSSNITGKQTWKSGAGKLSQTLNNVRTTFGVLSQRMRKSTKKRQALINGESPSSPVTPYTRSRAVLGRTPTKLYSPFNIDTPTGKENQSHRYFKDKTQPGNSFVKGEKKKLRRTRLDLGADMEETGINKEEAILSNELLQTQIGIYEFHSVANRIVQNGLNN